MGSLILWIFAYLDIINSIYSVCPLSASMCTLEYWLGTSFGNARRQVKKTYEEGPNMITCLLYLFRGQYNTNMWLGYAMSITI